MKRSTIAEARPLVDNLASVGPKRMRIRLLEGDRWGSSCYYPGDVIRRDGPAAFPVGTQMYLDHPTATEEVDRPERSVRDLAGTVDATPVYEKGGLYTDVLVYSHWAEVIKEMAEDIGISIRAVAEVEDGEAEGRQGPICRRLIEGLSVDYVTNAGAGGEIVKIIESARRETLKEAVSTTPWSNFSAADYTVQQWHNACLIHLHSGAATNKSDCKLPVKEPSGTLNKNGVIAAAGALSGARTPMTGVSADQKKSAAKTLVGYYRNQLKMDPPDNLLRMAGMSTSEKETKEALHSNRRTQVQRALEALYGNERTEVWLRDLDEDTKTAFFTVYGEGVARVFSQTYKPAADDNSVAMDGDRTEVMAQTNYVPVPATASAVQESAPESPEDNRKDAQMGDVTITEAEHQALTESSGKVETLTTELKEARKEAREATVREAKAVIERNRAEARLVVQTELWEAGVKAPSLAKALSVDPPLIKEGEERAGHVDDDELKKQVQEAIAEITIEMDGAGGVRGFGANGKKKETEVSEADLDKVSASVFGRKEVKS